MNIDKPVRKLRVARVAAVGAFVSLSLAAIGYRLDTAVPAISLDRQILYNWLTLLLSPISFLLRLKEPDSAIVPGIFFVLIAAASNAALYAFLCWSFSAVRQSLSPGVAASASAQAGVLSSATLAEMRSATRRFSPAERLADRYEHRLSSEHTDSSETEASVLSPTKH
jgi:hypothetical protein